MAGSIPRWRRIRRLVGKTEQIIRAMPEQRCPTAPGVPVTYPDVEQTLLHVAPFGQSWSDEVRDAHGSLAERGSFTAAGMQPKRAALSTRSGTTCVVPMLHCRPQWREPERDDRAWGSHTRSAARRSRFGGAICLMCGRSTREITGAAYASASE
jgi:hypothetical protein